MSISPDLNPLAGQRKEFPLPSILRGLWLLSCVAVYQLYRESVCSLDMVFRCCFWGLVAGGKCVWMALENFVQPPAYKFARFYH